MPEQPCVLRIRLKSVRELEAELADRNAVLSKISSIAAHPSGYDGGAVKALALIGKLSSQKS